MDYEKIIDLYSITVEECLTLYENSGLCILIQDGHIINFFKEEEKI